MDCMIFDFGQVEFVVLAKGERGGSSCIVWFLT